MSRVFEWCAALAIVVFFGMAGTDEYEEQQRAAEHKKEAIAAAHKNQRMADVERRLKDMTAFDRIVTK